ncbi:MAG: NAD(P)-dependent oxidoreductase, partial [bacterium]
MKALVTGATGFVGSHLVDRLIEKNYEVYCLKRKTSSTKWLDGKNVKFVEGDLFSNEALGNCIREMDYVFHVAGLVKAKTKQGFYHGNTEATKNLLEITYKVNPGIKKFIFISSQAAAGPTLTDKPKDENDKPEPITTYGITKLKAEEEVEKYKDKFPVTIIRPPAVFGPRDTEIL